MKIFTFTACLLMASVASVAQDVKHIDYQQAYEKNKVKSVNSLEVRFKGNQAVDTIPKGSAEMDERGRLVKYTEYFAKGRKNAVYTYHYDANGRLEAGEVACRTVDFKPVAFMMEFDKQGRMISRIPTEPIPGFWEREVFIYSNSGSLVRAEQHYPNGQMTFAEYPANIVPKENTMSWMYDQKGLVQSHQIFNRSGVSDRMIVFKYQHF